MTGYLWNIYHIQDKMKGQYKELKTKLPASRIEKAKNYRLQEDRERCIAAGVLLEYGLSIQGFSSDKVCILSGGKPYLPGNSCCFNLSHSGNYVAGIFGEKPCGIDVQQIEYDYGFFKEIFSEKEWSWVQERDSASRATCLWSLKEAFLKMEGKGIVGEFPIFDNAIKEEGVLKKSFSMEIQKLQCYFRLYDLPGYAVAVCCRETPPVLEEIL